SAGTVSIKDSLPTGMTFQSASPAPTWTDGRTFFWNFTNVAPGPHSLTMSAQVNPGFTGSQLVNWAFLNYTTAGGYALTGSRSSSSGSSGGPSGARNKREWLTAFHGSAAVRTARFVVHHKDGRLAYLGRRPKPSSEEGRLRAGSRTALPQGTWAGLTSGFGMGPGVSPPLWPSNHC